MKIKYIRLKKKKCMSIIYIVLKYNVKSFFCKTGKYNKKSEAFGDCHGKAIEFKLYFLSAEPNRKK